MSTKLCPFCSEEINKEAVKCKHCGEFLNNKPAKKPVASGRNLLGLFTLIIGLGLFFQAMTMTTTVEVDDSPLLFPNSHTMKVNNIGLMQQQQNYLHISIVLCVAGMICLYKKPIRN